MPKLLSPISSIRIVLLSSIFIVALTSCKRHVDKLTLQREWTANAEFAGDVWAQALSKQNGRELQVKEGSELLDPIKAVRSGAAQFGVASSDRVLRENEGGADLVVLAAATFKSPVVFLSHPKDHIKSPADFRRQVIGIQTGTNTELVFKSLLSSQKLQPTDMKVVESGWGTTNFESGAIAVLAAFDYDEPVQLQRKSVPFSIIFPEEYGVHYVGTVYFAKRSYVSAHPDLVQAFVDDLVAGWRQTINHPQEAMIKLSSAFPSIDSGKESDSLARGIPYFRGEDGQLLYASPARWEAMANNLIALKLLHSFTFDENVDYHFLETALHKEGSK